VFVGRAQELATVAGLVRAARVVALTGVGGVGKTRLAIQVAAGMVDEFPGGEWLVEFEPPNTTEPAVRVNEQTLQSIW
jgi:predicted ATPase